jgi:hypothetical protein
VRAAIPKPLPNNWHINRMWMAVPPLCPAVPMIGAAHAGHQGPVTGIADQDFVAAL